MNLIFYIYNYLKPWLITNLFSNNKGIAGLPWSLMFGFICWFVWKWRNRYVFNLGEEFPAHPQIIILHVAKEWLRNAYALKFTTDKV